MLFSFQQILRGKMVPPAVSFNGESSSMWRQCKMVVHGPWFILPAGLDRAHKRCWERNQSECVCKRAACLPEKNELLNAFMHIREFNVKKQTRLLKCLLMWWHFIIRLYMLMLVNAVTSTNMIMLTFLNAVMLTVMQ